MVERELSMLPSLYSLRDVVTALLEQRLERGDGVSGLEEIARMLAMSPRTLQARLHEEETSLRNLVDVVRHRLAARWLAAGLSRHDFAARLGFREAAAFRRAWRRWNASRAAGTALEARPLRGPSGQRVGARSCSSSQAKATITRA